MIDSAPYPDIAGWEDEGALAAFARLACGPDLPDDAVAAAFRRLTDRQVRMVRNLVRSAAEFLED